MSDIVNIIPFNKLANQPGEQTHWTSQHYEPDPSLDLKAQFEMELTRKALTLDASIGPEDKDKIAQYYSQGPTYPSKLLLQSQLIAFFGMPITAKEVLVKTGQEISCFKDAQGHVNLRVVIRNIQFLIAQGLDPQRMLYDEFHDPFNLPSVEIELICRLDEREAYPKDESIPTRKMAFHIESFKVSGPAEHVALISDLLTYNALEESKEIKQQRRDLQNAKGFEAVIELKKQQQQDNWVDGQLIDDKGLNPNPENSLAVMSFLTKNMLPQDVWRQLDRLYHSKGKIFLIKLRHKFDAYMVSPEHSKARKAFDAQVAAALVQQYNAVPAQETKLQKAKDSLSSFDALIPPAPSPFVTARVDVLYPRLVATKPEMPESSVAQVAASVCQKDSARACAMYIRERILSGEYKVGLFGRFGGETVEGVKVSYCQKLMYGKIEAAFEQEKQGAGSVHWPSILKNVLKDLRSAQQTFSLTRTKEMTNSYSAMRRDIENILPAEQVNPMAKVWSGQNHSGSSLLFAAKALTAASPLPSFVPASNGPDLTRTNFGSRKH